MNIIHILADEQVLKHICHTEVRKEREKEI